MDGYDFIVVGAGSAGCAVARRLSDNPELRVLLLEAGPKADDFWIRTPAGMARMFNHRHFNWNFYTEPVPTLNERILYWPRGKVLGGSSAINGMVYVRGDRRDFDHWAQLGNAGWGWDDVLPYFIRSEANTRGQDAFHGATGPMAVSDPVQIHPTIHDFVRAAQACGLDYVRDFNAGDQDGVGYLQFNIRKGVRESAYDAFIKPIEGRRNLTILTGVHVARVLFSGKTATGVEIIEAGERRVLEARHEIVLCGGALSTPHILMLSGIGNGEMLRRNAIETVAHLPGVGENLQDHFSTRLQIRSTRESSYNRDLLGWRKYWQGARYVLTKKGYLALGSSTAAAFIKSNPNLNYGDLELSFRPMTFAFDASGEPAIHDYDAVGASVYRVRPASRGNIRLKSPDPLEAPAFNPNYLGDPADVEASLTGLRALRRILATEPMRSHLLGEILPGDDVKTDDQLIDYMRREGHCAFHPAGSCKMGRDAMAVVDERLRVHGVERLRVVDASIMPVVTSGNTNAPTVMIGEKGADLILRDMKIEDSRAAARHERNQT